MEESYQISLKGYYVKIAESFKEAEKSRCLQDTRIGSLDGKTIKSSRFTLCAASGKFMNILKTTEHENPGITHTGATQEEVRSLHHYIHTGESSHERHLRFLHLGAELDIDSLISFCSYSDCYKIMATFCESGNTFDSVGICSEDCFNGSIFSSFKRLRGEDFLKDMTLVSTDGEEIKVHKIVLYTFSGFFKKYLRSKNIESRVWVPYSDEEIEVLLELFYSGKVIIKGRKCLTNVMNMLKTFEVNDFSHDANEELNEPIENEANEELNENMKKGESSILKKDELEPSRDATNKEFYNEELQDILDGVLEKVLQNSDLRSIIEDLMSNVVKIMEN